MRPPQLHCFPAHLHLPLLKYSAISAPLGLQKRIAPLPVANGRAQVRGDHVSRPCETLQGLVGARTVPASAAEYALGLQDSGLGSLQLADLRVDCIEPVRGLRRALAGAAAQPSRGGRGSAVQAPPTDAKRLLPSQTE